MSPWSHFARHAKFLGVHNVCAVGQQGARHWVDLRDSLRVCPGGTLPNFMSEKTSFCNNRLQSPAPSKSMCDGQPAIALVTAAA